MISGKRGVETLLLLPRMLLHEGIVPRRIVCPETTILSHLFRVVLSVYLFPLSVRNCRCGRPLDACGHHNMFLQDMDLGVPGRRLEVVVDGLPLQGGAQLAVDTAMVCALHDDVRPRQGAAKNDGVALKAARRKKATDYLELVGTHSRAKLVVMAVEVGGRWSEETRAFLSQVAKARSRSEEPLTHRRAEQAWRLRWSASWRAQRPRQWPLRCWTCWTVTEVTGRRP